MISSIRHSLASTGIATKSLRLGGYHTSASILGQKNRRPKRGEKRVYKKKKRAIKPTPIDESIDPPTSFDVPVISLDTFEETSQTLALPPALFGAPIRKDILQRVVVWTLACRRKGTAKQKNKAEKSGSGRKIRKQKGGGTARVGQKNAPHRRGGGRAFPQRPRSYAYTLPKKVRRMGLCCVLSSKFAQRKLVVFDTTEIESPKTKTFFNNIEPYLNGGTLIVGGHDLSKNLYLATRNIPNVEYVKQERTSVYDVIKRSHLFIAKDTIPYLVNRVNGTLPRVPKVKAIIRRENQRKEHERIQHWMSRVNWKDFKAAGKLKKKKDKKSKKAKTFRPMKKIKPHIMAEE